MRLGVACLYVHAETLLSSSGPYLFQPHELGIQLVHTYYIHKQTQKQNVRTPTERVSIIIIHHGTDAASEIITVNHLHD